MTGGLAWVYDADGAFVRDGRFHPEFVKPEAFVSVDPESQSALRDLVALHAERAQSSLARALLTKWDEASAAFVRLTPRPQA
jgi:glutamate synthase (NADPH/NADH) large chain